MMLPVLSLKEIPRRKRVPPFLLSAIACLCIQTVPADARAGLDVGDVTIAWDANPEPSVTGYRVCWGPVRRNIASYENVVDVGNTTQYTLELLAAGQPYYVAITAYTGSPPEVGSYPPTVNESDFSDEATITFVGGGTDLPVGEGRIVLLEAESGTLTPPMVTASSDSTTWIQSDDTVYAPDQGTATLTFDALVEADYYIWCRVFAPDSGSDSFYVGMDEPATTVFHAHGTPEPPAGYPDDWVWRQVRVTDGPARAYPLTAGNHTLTFRNREPGMRLDRVVLSTNPDFVPDDGLPRSGNVVTLVRGPFSVTTQAGTDVRLDVEAVSTGPIAYQWFKNSEALVNKTSKQLLLETVDPVDEGNYNVYLFSDSFLTISTPAFVTVLAADLKVGRMTMGAGNQVSFDVTGGTPGTTVTIFASNSLSGWEVIGTADLGAGPIQIADPGAAGQPKRFYKLETP